MKKHRGEIVEKAVRQSGYSIKRLAERMGISRNTIYNRFGEPELSYEFIAIVGRLIHYDFSFELPEVVPFLQVASEALPPYLSKEIAERIKIEQKYIDLLERYNKLLNIVLRLANNNEIGAIQKELLHFMDEKDSGISDI